LTVAVQRVGDTARGGFRVRIAWLASLVVCLAACGGSGSRGVAPSATPGPVAPRLTLNGETFVYARTLPASALVAENLRAAGSAVAADGSVTSVARGETDDAQPWELVSSASDGWRVWWPVAVTDTLAAAGPGATLVLVAQMTWPDACTGLAEPGEVCAQVITAGYVIVVEQGGQRTEYHASALSGTRRTAP
jgi:hypothetical protein